MLNYRIDDQGDMMLTDRHDNYVGMIARMRHGDFMVYIEGDAVTVTGYMSLEAAQYRALAEYIEMGGK